MTSKIEWAQQIKAAGIELLYEHALKTGLQEMRELTGLSNPNSLPPENWGKLSTSRAEAVKDKLLGKATKSVASIIGAGIGRMAGAILATGSALVNATEAAVDLVSATKAVEDTRRPQAKAATMPKNPNWGRSEKRLGKTQFYPVRRFAADPVPLTRQVRRQNERREQKMPLGARQSIWHDVMGYGKIGNRREL